MRVVGVGVDIIENRRIQDLLQKEYARRFLSRVLHQEELKHFSTISQLTLQTQYVASRWAVKEAAVKAIGRRQLIFTQLQVIKNAIGKPNFSVEGDFNAQLLAEAGVARLEISLAHEQHYTIAFAMALGDA